MLLVGLLASRVRERVVPALTIITLAAPIGLAISRFHHPALDHLRARCGSTTWRSSSTCSSRARRSRRVLLSLRAVAPREAGHGEYHALLIFSVLGMAVLVSAQNLITLFIGIELLSIPLYVLCASEPGARARSNRGSST